MPDETLAPTKDLAALLDELARCDALFASAGEDVRAALGAYRQAIEALHGEALRRLVRALRGDEAAAARLRTAAADEVVYAVLRRHEIVKPSIDERVETALQSVRPMLASHGGDVALVRVDPPRIVLRFVGACDGCAASTLTLRSAVMSAVRAACPEITQIAQEKGPESLALGDTDEQPGWRPAGMLTDIPDRGIRVLTIEGEPLILFRRGESVTCFEAVCPHRGVRLGDNLTEDGHLICYQHGYLFDLATGDCLTMPGLPLWSRAASVVAGRVLVRLGT